MSPTELWQLGPSQLTQSKYISWSRWELARDDQAEGRVCLAPWRQFPAEVSQAASCSGEHCIQEVAILGLCDPGNVAGLH